MIRFTPHRRFLSTGIEGFEDALLEDRIGLQPEPCILNFRLSETRKRRSSSALALADWILRTGSCAHVGTRVNQHLANRVKLVMAVACMA